MIEQHDRDLLTLLVYGARTSYRRMSDCAEDHFVGVGRHLEVAVGCLSTSI